MTKNICRYCQDMGHWQRDCETPHELCHFLEYCWVRRGHAHFDKQPCELPTIPRSKTTTWRQATLDELWHTLTPKEEDWKCVEVTSQDEGDDVTTMRMPTIRYPTPDFTPAPASPAASSSTPLLSDTASPLDVLASAAEEERLEREHAMEHACFCKRSICFYHDRY